MTATSTPALRLSVTAVTEYVNGDFVPNFDRIQSATVGAQVTDLETAKEIAALFPKMVGLTATTLSGSREGNTGYLHFSVKLAKDGVNGGKNETGIKRLQRLLAVAAKNGLAVEYVANFSNSYPTMDAALAAVTA